MHRQEIYGQVRISENNGDIWSFLVTRFSPSVWSGDVQYAHSQNLVAGMKNVFLWTQPRICLRNILPLPLSKFGGDGMWFWWRECNLQIETMPWWRLVRIVTSGPENMFNSLVGHNCNQRQNCSRWTEVSCLRFHRTAMFEVEPFVPHCKGPHKKGARW